MARIIWTVPALQELDEVADYISDNPEAAKRLVRNTFKRVEQLTHHPKSGKSVEELKGSIYRELVLPPCRIFYREENDSIYIIHIIREEKTLHIDILKSR